MQNTAIVIQTCDKYEFLWQGWYYYFMKYWDDEIPCEIYFCTEQINPKWDHGLRPLFPYIVHVGMGEWGERLLRILNNLPNNIDTVFYMQEDFWLHRTLPKKVFESRLKMFRDWDMDAYRCCISSKHFKFVGKYPPQLFAIDSPYLLTHQASFWKRNFFQDCVLPHETAWENEKRGTERIMKAGNHRIYFAPFNFYHAVCCKGKLTDLGRQLDAEAKYRTDSI